MTISMTGYAEAGATHEGWAWTWELRGVNGKGLDIRFRMPDWIPGLEPEIRNHLQGVVDRGSIFVGLRVRPSAPGSDMVDVDAIERALDRISATERIAAARGMPLTPCRATDIIALAADRSDAATPPGDVAALRTALSRHFRDTILTDFAAMRAAEGAALHGILRARLDRIADLAAEAARRAEARGDAARTALRAAMERVLSEVETDPDRLAKELAMLAAKTDVTEEIDRLRAHAEAARSLLEEAGPAGRKLNFLMQELNREANTLCAKSQDTALTRTGLDLKTTIEQMREQVQNVE